MITVSTAPPALSSCNLSLYYAKDSLLDNLPILVFYGPSTTGNSTQNSSRIQAHVYSLAGFQTFHRLTVAPTSPLYAAVNHLPAENQGDEICRGLAVSLLSYFAGLPNSLKTSLRDRAAARRPNRAAPMMFDEMHAAELAAIMVEIEDRSEITNYVMSALWTQVLSWVDMDVILPPGTIQRAKSSESDDSIPLFDNDGLPLYNYGHYTSIIESLGSPAFLPTSKLQRAPSRPTAHSRSRIISKDQKIALRREMCELVDTESSYIGKIRNVVQSIAADFRQIARSNLVNELFPESLDHILETNEKFYTDVQAVLEETENEAINDIEGNASNESDLGSPITQGRRRDPTGNLHFAKALLKWFPKFMGPYQEYLRASTNFSSIISQLLADQSSAVSKHLHNFGEQRLRSALIEPVQRLPRYSLFIDNMVNLLPASHPALSSLLKARDVITDICALDTQLPGDFARSARILRNIVANWPTTFSPRGRLISAMDVVELNPPYATTGEGTPGIVLLFVDSIVLLQKPRNDSSLSARGIIAELDRPTPTNAFLSSSLSFDRDLIYSGAYDLSQLRFSESESGDLIRMTLFGGTTSNLDTSRHLQDFTKVFLALGPYDCKTARFSEEVVKAGIENRFSESARDSGKWALRSVNPSPGSLGLLVALLEKQAESTADLTQGRSKIRLDVDTPKNESSVGTQHQGTEIAGSITTLDSGSYRLDTEGLDGTWYTDICTTENIWSLLLRRLGDLVHLQHQPHNSMLIQSQISYNTTILAALPLRKPQADTRSRVFRPISPVKMISNLLNTGQTSLSVTPSKIHHDLPPIRNVPSLPPRTPAKTSPDSSDIFLNNKVTLVETAAETYNSPLALLEHTFTAYVVALRSRSGNVVGRVLRSRATADELIVNELYNILLEDPSRLQAAAEVSVDVLFAAFEKFLQRAWRERMGPLLAANVLRGLQVTFDSGRPAVFSQQFKRSLEDMSPQNGRAFAATIKLLSDLLEASGNDGDRGALIASFAEALVIDGNPHDYITLLDRLVDDYDSLFDESSAQNDLDGSTGSATGSLKRTRSVNTGSLSSNTSSLKKRFGLGGLSRENSKNESESKVASLWRTLSKNTRSPGEGHSQPPSLSKASLGRSRSTDTDSRMLPPLRPVSRDRPTTSGVMTQNELKPRPGSAHLNTSTLSSIGEGTPTKTAPLPKKKHRRSSLSDITSIRDPDVMAAWSPLQPRKPANLGASNSRIATPPRTPSPIKQSPIPGITKQSPQLSGLPRRFGSPQRKENSPVRETSQTSNSPSLPRTPSAKAADKNQSEAVVITSFSPQKQQVSRSGIPAPKGGLTERTWPPNGNTSISKPSSEAPHKLRMQSPQKLRERLIQEQKSVASADSSLQAEIAKIGDEISFVYKTQRSPTKKTFQPQPPSAPHSLSSLSTQLSNISTQLSTFTTTHTTSLKSLSSQVESSLLVSDKKVRKLDELYREANAENEALYERFNDELGKILGKVKKGEGVEETRSKLKEAQDEVARLKKENGKLKREVVALRSLMKEG